MYFGVMDSLGRYQSGAFFLCVLKGMFSQNYLWKTVQAFSFFFSFLFWVVALIMEWFNLFTTTLHTYGS